MNRCLALCATAALLTGGCATGGLIGGAIGSASSRPSSVVVPTVVGYAIDAVIVAAIIGDGEISEGETAGLLLVGLDAAIATALIIDLVRK